MEEVVTALSDGEGPSKEVDVFVDQQDLSSSYKASSDNENDSGDGGDDMAYMRDFSDEEQVGRNFEHGDRKLSYSPSTNAASQRDMTSPAPIPFRSRPRKRKANRSVGKNFTPKRLKGVYNDGYRKLLNDNIRDVASHSASEGYDPLPESQIGVSIWTSIEKEVFFNALSRLGKDDIRGIAYRIGSKSEPEVREYVQLLHQGLMERKNHEPRRQLVSFMDFPAAVQISQECCDMLDDAAEALAFRQDRHEENEEHKKWGDQWLLNSEVNHWVEKHLDGEEGSLDLKEVLPAAEILNLHNWLELSTRIFMNPAAPREDENWQKIADFGEEPAIRATAFADFHRLATSVTKRLLSASIFCTMSRLRAMDPRSFNRYEIVKRADVEAAARIIGLEINSKGFWTRCARRCNLEVFRTLSSSLTDPSPMDYDEVEEVLSKEAIHYQSLEKTSEEAGKSPVQSAESHIPQGDSAKAGNLPRKSCSRTGLGTRSESPDELHRDLATEYMQATMLEYQDPVDPSDSGFEQPHSHRMRLLKSARSKELYDIAQNEYAEAFDLQMSLLEEQKLWDILKQDPPFSIKPDKVDLPNYPTQEKKYEDEIQDWRDQLEFWSQWETLETPVPADAFTKLSTSQRRGFTSLSEDEADESGSSVIKDDTEETVPESREEVASEESDKESDNSSSADHGSSL